jgi:hypothetical protein
MKRAGITSRPEDAEGSREDTEGMLTAKAHRTQRMGLGFSCRNRNARHVPEPKVEWASRLFYVRLRDEGASAARSQLKDYGPGTSNF